MTLEQLRIFIAVAERENMTRAAEAVHITQSAVSGAIAALEAAHDVHLFHRVGRRIELTDAGRMFLGEARGILARVESARAALSDWAGLRRGRLVIAASQTIAAYWLPERLARFRGATPISISTWRSPHRRHRARGAGGRGGARLCRRCARRSGAGAMADRHRPHGVGRAARDGGHRSCNQRLAGADRLDHARAGIGHAIEL